MKPQTHRLEPSEQTETSQKFRCTKCGWVVALPRDGFKVDSHALMNAARGVCKAEGER